MKKTPNPGSDAAIKQGCTCPILDNGCGSGSIIGQFWITEGCPIHDLGDWSYDADKKA
jgi:hypothetical protein